MIDPQQSAAASIPVIGSLSRVVVAVPYPIAAPGAHDVIDDVPACSKVEDANAALLPIDRGLRFAKDATGSETRKSEVRADRQGRAPLQFRLYGLGPAKAKPLSFVEWNPLVLPKDRVIARETLAKCERKPNSICQFEPPIRRVGTGDIRWFLAIIRVTETGKDRNCIRFPGLTLDIPNSRGR